MAVPRVLSVDPFQTKGYGRVTVVKPSRGLALGLSGRADLDGGPDASRIFLPGPQNRVMLIGTAEGAREPLGIGGTSGQGARRRAGPLALGGGCKYVRPLRGAVLCSLESVTGGFVMKRVRSRYFRRWLGLAMALVALSPNFASAGWWSDWWLHWEREVSWYTWAVPGDGPFDHAGIFGASVCPWRPYGWPPACASVLFDDPGSHRVWFGSSRTTKKLIVRDGEVEFDVYSSGTYRTYTTNDVTVGDRAEKVARLTLSRGTLSGISADISTIRNGSGSVCVDGARIGVDPLWGPWRR